MSAGARTRPPWALGVEPALVRLAASGELPSLRPGQLPARRNAAVHDDLSIFALARRDVTISSHGTRLAGTIFTLPNVEPRATLLYLHGGGLAMGDRFDGIAAFLPWAAEHRIAIATFNYRLAPEHPAPAALRDAEAALAWVAQHSGEWGANCDRILVGGESAGACLAAGVAIAARDHGDPGILGQLLICPMLDDRLATTSASQFADVGVWDRDSVRLAWAAALGDTHPADLPSGTVPGRVTDLSDLPPAFIDVGSAEVFRDEAVAYASGLWAAGGDAELHVWPGGTHTWEKLIPASSLATEAVRARSAWLGRLLDR